LLERAKRSFKASIYIN